MSVLFFYLKNREAERADMGNKSSTVKKPGDFRVKKRNRVKLLLPQCFLRDANACNSFLTDFVLSRH